MHYDFNPRWYRPRTIEDAVEILHNESGKGIHILAGGTDLNVRIRDGQVLPDAILDITGIDELGSIVIRATAAIPVSNQEIEPVPEASPSSGEFVSIGAAVTMAGLMRSELLKERLPALVKAAGEVGSPLIRNVATIGGNVMNASPAADMSTMLVPLRCLAALRGRSGTRMIPLNEVFTGVCSTCIGQDELLSHLLIPVTEGTMGTGFHKLKRREALALSIVNSGAMLESDGVRITDAALSVGAVAVTPLLVSAVEKKLVGKDIAQVEDLLEGIAFSAMELSKPITDVRGSADYRREMVRVCSLRALHEALESLIIALEGAGMEVV